MDQMRLTSKSYFLGQSSRLMLAKTGALEPNYSGTPDPAFARKPDPARGSESEMEIPVIYSAISKPDADEEGKNPTHVRAGDGKVIISQDPLSSYNASGSYQNKASEKCCTICPQADDCDHDCYSKCHRFCGEQCQIGKAGTECTIGLDCGLTGSDKTISGDQDMVTGYEKMKAPAGRDAKTPDAPLKDEDRFPLPERTEDKRDTPDVAEIAPEPLGEVKDPYPAVDEGATGPTGPVEDAENEGDEEEVVSKQIVHSEPKRLR